MSWVDSFNAQQRDYGRSRYEPPAPSSPSWWTLELEKAKPCECNVGFTIADKATGYSDFYYERRVCPKCTKEWGYWLEG